MFSLKKLALFVIPAAFILTSCDKEEDPKPSPNPDNQPVNNLPALVLTAFALLAVFRLRIGMIPVLLATAGLGLAWHLATG